MGVWDVLIIVFVVLVAVAAGLYFLNRWASRRMADQQDIVERNKTTVPVYIIDKKKDKITNANLPKAVSGQIPKWYRFMKIPLVKAKVGPQILTLLCDNKVYQVLPVKKTVKVEMAGMYIVGMQGMKTKKEMEELRKNRKEKNADAPAKSFISRIFRRG